MCLLDDLDEILYLSETIVGEIFHLSEIGTIIFFISVLPLFCTLDKTVFFRRNRLGKAEISDLLLKYSCLRNSNRGDFSAAYGKFPQGASKRHPR